MNHCTIKVGLFKNCSVFKSVTDPQLVCLHAHQQDGYIEKMARTFAFTVLETYPWSLYAINNSHLTPFMMFFTWWSVSCLRSVCSSIVYVCVYSSSPCSKDGLCDMLRVLAVCQHLWKWQCVRKPRLEIEQDREKGREVFPTSYTSFCLSNCSVYHSAVYWQSLQKKL